MTQKGKFAPPNGWKSMVVKMDPDKWIDGMVAVCEVCQRAHNFNIQPHFTPIELARKHSRWSILCN